MSVNARVAAAQLFSFDAVGKSLAQHYELIISHRKNSV
jgi:hypothetical protein